MSSFANTNETKLAANSPNNVENEKTTNDPCIIKIKTVVVTGAPGATSIDDGIVITVTVLTVNICDQFGPIK